MKGAFNRIWRIATVAARPLGVWLVFYVVLRLSNGVLYGGIALLAASILAAWLWHRRTPQIHLGGWHALSTRARIMRTLPLACTLLPMLVLAVPQASRQLDPLKADPAVQNWTTFDGRSVAVYRYPAAPQAKDRGQALVFVHGGPGAYIRNFDRDFLARFAGEGFDVVLYDQYGSGHSPLGDPQTYTHAGNVGDLLAVLDHVAKPVILIGQSYGAAVVASALQSPRARRWVTKVVLTEPGKLPGSALSTDPAHSEKTTVAPDAAQAPPLSILPSLLAPRMLMATLLPPGNRLVPQEELINLATPAFQRYLIASGYCRGAASQLDQFEALRFNTAANIAVSLSSRKAEQPQLHSLDVPVMLLLGECSYVPRGRAMAYFDAMPIARSQWLPGVGHILWGTESGQQMTHEAIVRFIDGRPAAFPNEPTAATRDAFVQAGR